MLGVARSAAEESLKNKLAQAARDKLAATVKEEGKLKAERKKKAAMFAALLSKAPPNASDSGTGKNQILKSIDQLLYLASFMLLAHSDINVGCV